MVPLGVQDRGIHVFLETPVWTEARTKGWVGPRGCFAVGDSISYSQSICVVLESVGTNMHHQV